jgi:hypothetical protein
MEIKTEVAHKVIWRISYRMDYFGAYCECGFEMASVNVKIIGGIQTGKNLARHEHDLFVSAGA